MKILGFGAVLWDEISGEKNIGGAVFNLVTHCRKLGAEAFFYTAVGADKLGERTIELVRDLGIHTDFVKTVDWPTCVVKVSIDESGGAKYSVPTMTSWDFIAATEEDFSTVDSLDFDYFCFGTIEQRSSTSRKTLRSLLRHCRFKNIFLDANLRLDYYNRAILQYSLRQSNMAKFNKEEMSIVSKLLGFGQVGYEDFIQIMIRRYGLKLVCVTLGRDGALLGSNTELVHCPGYTVEVSDTVGAGDAFSAGLLLKEHSAVSLHETVDFACRLGSIVASRRGAIPDYELDDILSLSNMNQN